MIPKDAIDILKDMQNNLEEKDFIDRCALDKAIEALKQERPHGEWIRNDNGTYSCSVCQSWIPNEQHHYARFCLYCGSDNRPKEGDENG